MFQLHLCNDVFNYAHTNQMMLDEPEGPQTV